MMNWLKKVLSLLIAIALLVSAGALAFAEENAEPIEPAAEEAVQQSGDDVGQQDADAAAAEAAAQQAAEAAAAEAAAQQAAEAAAAEAAAQQAAEAAAAEAAAQQAAEAAAAQEAEPVPSYNNSEDTSNVTDVPAANDEPAVIDAPVVNDEPVAEDVPAANNEPAVNDTPAANDEPAANDAPTADDDVDDPNDPTIIFIDDGDKGHTDQETVKELGLNMTDEVVFADAITLSLNVPASAGIDAENRAEFLFTAESDMTVVLGLEASSEAVDVRINGDAVHFTKIAGTEYDGGLNALCELNLTAGKYDIILTSSYNVYVTLTAMDPATAQAKVDAIAAAKAEANNAPAVVSNEDNNENTDGENEGNTDTDTNLEGNVNAGNENNTDENTTEEEVIPPMVGWITVDTESYGIGSTITLTAASESDLGEMVAWQTKVGGEDWKGAGYGSTLTVGLNEENINSSFRFRMEDGNYSAEYTLNPVEVKAEEAAETDESEETTETIGESADTEGTEEAEETVDETDEKEQTEETDEVEEAEETEEDKLVALGCVKVTVTAEEGADLYAEADKESEVVGHLDAEAEIWVILNEEQTWGQLYAEDEEAAAQYIFMEDAEIVVAEETEEETEETEEAEENEEEKMAALGCTKVVVTAEEGADLYAEADKESEVTGHLDAKTEIWVILNDELTWGQLYSEDEEAAAQFISMEDAEIVVIEEKTEEAEETEEDKMTALGCTKVIVTAEEGANLYADADKESEVVGHLDIETAIWVILNEEQTWGQIYTEDEETAAQFISMEDAEIVVIEEETKETEEVLTDEELIELGYRKVQVLNENGVDVYASTEEDAEAIGHIDFEEEIWIKDAEAEGWAEIYTEEEEEAGFVKLDELDKQPLTDEELIELGYRKVQVLNEDGADIYAAAEEEAEVIGHADFEEELWIKDTEVEDWAELYTEEEENSRFVKLDEIREQTEEEKMLKHGYWKAQIALQNGADVHSEMDKESPIIEHIELGTEIWIKLKRGTGWAEVYYEEEGKTGYIQIDALVVTLMDKEIEEDDSIRSVKASTSLEGREMVYYGTDVELTAELFGFAEDDEYLIQWMYSPDERENFYNAEDGNELVYVYSFEEETEHYIWKIVITLLPKEIDDEIEEAE